MQNRFVLSGIPSKVRYRCGAEDDFRMMVEDSTCWIDRFAWIEDCGDELVAAIELNLENVRDQAVAKFDGQEMRLPTHDLCFVARAAPATSEQSELLLKACPENGKLISDEQELLQTIQFNTSAQHNTEISLQIHRTTEGGTGSETWKGGLLLAQQICCWSIKKQGHKLDGTGIRSFDKFFSDKDVLELGAGSAGLPSLTLASVSHSLGFSPRSIAATDAIDEVLQMLQKNVSANNVCVNVQNINWNSVPSSVVQSADCILFADCIYTEQGGMALCHAIHKILRTEGTVIGVLPDFRVGVTLFEAEMRKRGFSPTEIPIPSLPPATTNKKKRQFRCAGGSSTNYRIIWWSAP